MTDTPSAYADRIRSMNEQYQEDCTDFEQPTNPPADEQAMAYLRDGVGPTVMLYVDARANNWGVEFAEWEFEVLHETMNGYLELYTRCYGVELDADFTIREAAELLIDTHNIRDVAVMLTQVPNRTATAEN